MSPEEKFASFAALGEAKVRHAIGSAEWSGTEAALAKQWLEMEASSKRDAREERTLRAAQLANAIAIIAAIIAIVAIVIAK